MKQRDMFVDGNQDADNCRAMSVPFASPDECNDALMAFYADVEAARKKHRMREVVIAVAGNVRYEDGTETPFITHSAWGSAAEWPGVAAYLYGALRAEMTERLNRCLELGQRRGKGASK